jgi:hypothetical protein
MFGHQQLKLSAKENNPLAERTIVRAPGHLHPAGRIILLRDEQQLATG